jgi:hypothetical protein
MNQFIVNNSTILLMFILAELKMRLTTDVKDKKEEGTMKRIN